MLETPARIEPCFFEEHIPTELADLSVDIQREATGLGLGLHPDSAAELEEETRPLALEARAQVIVQRAIDEMHRIGTLPRPTSVEFLTWVHKSFYDEMPDEFRVIEHPDGTQKPIAPGRMRQDDDREAAVGRHLPPSSSCVAAFMDHFDKRFQIAARSSSGRIIAIASAHHRLNYIHPFPDGNGRVSRLMSHAMALITWAGPQVNRSGRVQTDDESG